MTAFAGSALYCAWVYSGGTVVLSGDYRTLSISQSVEVIDATAGADTYREKLASFGDSEVSWSSVLQSGGTALIAALAQKTTGTLIVGVEGTASTKPKFSVAAFSNGPSFNAAYNDIVEFSCTWTSMGAPDLTPWS